MRVGGQRAGRAGGRQLVDVVRGPGNVVGLPRFSTYGGDARWRGGAAGAVPEALVTDGYSSGRNVVAVAAGRVTRAEAGTESRDRNGGAS